MSSPRALASADASARASELRDTTLAARRGCDDARGGGLTDETNNNAATSFRRFSRHRHSFAARAIVAPHEPSQHPQRAR